jgi:hypothetical protein
MLLLAAEMAAAKCTWLGARSVALACHMLPSLLRCEGHNCDSVCH